MSISAQRNGRRTYIQGKTFPFRDQLRAAGCHWDADAKAWWIGDHDAALALVAKLVTEKPADEPTDSERLERDCSAILGRATYQQRAYYLVGQGENDRGPWVRLLFRDGSKTFFRPAHDVRIDALYASPRSLRDLRAYAEQMKNARDIGACECDDCRGRCPACRCEPHCVCKGGNVYDC